jgi:hypothetical protein
MLATSVTIALDEVAMRIAINVPITRMNNQRGLIVRQFDAHATGPQERPGPVTVVSTHSGRSVRAAMGRGLPAGNDHVV